MTISTATIRPPFNKTGLGLMLLVLVVPLALSAQEQNQLIQGTVVDNDGNPVARAKLWYAYAFNKLSGERLEVATRSDADGKFKLEVPPVAAADHHVRQPSASVWAYSPKHCLASLSLASDNRDERGIRMELVPATDTSVLVLDPGGHPLAGVIVEPVNYRTDLGYELIPDGAKPLVGARTDDLGRVRLPALARDRLFNVWVTTKAFGVQTKRFTVNADAPAEKVVRLRQPCTIRGRVIAEKPEWARGIRLAFTTDDTVVGVRPPWPTQGYAEATTDEQGRFEVSGIASGRLRIDTVVNETLPVRPQLPRFVQLPAGKTAEIELAMAPLVEIRSSVRARDTKEPLAGVELHVYYGTFRQGTDATTDAEGRFTARVLPGAVRFQPMNLHKTTYLQFGSPKSFDVPKGVIAVEFPAIELVPSKPLAGRVIDQEDQPVGSAEVVAYYGNWLCSAATTDEDGRFKLPKMPQPIEAGAATYRVRLGFGETRYMRTGDVEIGQPDPLVLRVKR